MDEAVKVIVRSGDVYPATAEEIENERVGKIRTELQILDQKLSRFDEDLYNVLIAKGILALSDLPAEAQTVLTSKANKRAEL